ncbi:Transcriptional regulator, GntR family [Methylocella tundrae]|uniref:Transcriptional regulator, GntR family n=1 Tax=Methylocella tundrae TaxID=227605 RepID=A0A8B6M805_METTU|nr:GntR family transcriptional regulator [Methylocella tundrae]VTZ51163.1 Transcriptional regulator, GntR family [Methylocella tundrae]
MFFPLIDLDKQEKSLTQVEQVINRLRADIISGRLLPAAKLSITTLAEESGVSLGAVREALASLAAEDLVVAEPQRGYRVSPVSSQSLSDLAQARIEIESLCLTEAIKHGDLQWESACIAALDQLRKVDSVVVGDCHELADAKSRAHAKFHYALASGCNNQWLLRMQRALYQQSERYRRLTVPLVGRGRDVDGEHKALLQAMLDRDPDRARKLLTQHLLTTARDLLTSPLLTQDMRSGGPT